MRAESNSREQIAQTREFRWLLLRVGIVFLRLLPILAALLWVTFPFEFGVAKFIDYSPPLQKRFYAPVVLFVSSLLVLVPFILLRFTIVYRVYKMLFLCCLVFLAYDYLIPFRYEAPAAQVTGPNAHGWLCNSWTDDGVVYWRSEHWFPPGDDIATYVPFIGTFVLALIYRRFFLRWSGDTGQTVAAEPSGIEQSDIRRTP